MAAQGSRTLKLSLLADVAEFSKGIKTASKDTETVGDQFTAFGKKAALAFAVAGAAIGAYAKEAIVNAAADEKAQRNLALTIENTTTATALQIAGVEKYISTTSVAIGVTDDELRPAFSRLVRSTKDVEDAQKLLNLALDVSAATGKPLEAVANALGKAYDGNLNALGRLGLGIDQSILKSKDFDLVFNTLTKTFGGFAENEADSTEKAFARIKIASDEVQEQIGAALLPVIQELTAFILTDVVPIIQGFVDGLTGQDGLTTGLSESQIAAIAWGKKVKGVIETVIEFKDELIAVAAIIGTIFVANKIAAGVTATIALIKLITAAYVALRNTALAAAIASRFAINPFLGLAAAAGIAAAIYAATKIFGNEDSMDAPFTGSIPFASGFNPANDFIENDAAIAAKKRADAAAKAAAEAAAKGSPDAAALAAAAKAAAEASAKAAEEAAAKATKSSLADAAAKAAAAAAKAAAETESKLVAGSFDSGLSGTQSLAAIDAISNRPFAFGTSGADTSTLAGIMAASAQQTVVINVNAPSIIDEEGFARAVTEAQNNSFFRGTGGATNFVGIAK